MGTLGNFIGWLGDELGKQAKKFDVLWVTDKTKDLAEFLEYHGTHLWNLPKHAIKELSDMRSALQIELEEIKENFKRQARAVIRSIKRQLVLLKLQISPPNNALMNTFGGFMWG